MARAGGGRDASNPLLERVKFLSIVGSNLDEFFMVRVAGLIDQVDAGILEVGPDGMSPRAQLVAIRREVKKLLDEAHQCLQDELLPALAEAGIHVPDYHALNARQLQVCKRISRRPFFRCSRRWLSTRAARFRTSRTSA